MKPAADRLGFWIAAARRREIASLLLVILPPMLAALVVIWRIVAPRAAVIAAALSFALLVRLLWRAVRRDLRTAITRRLDAQAPQLEDSSGLLWRAQTEPGTLADLQRARLLARLDGLAVEVRAPWPRARMLASAAVSLALFALAAVWPQAVGQREARVAGVTAGSTTSTRIEAARVEIEPPAYTKLPARSEAALDFEVAQDSRLVWDLRLTPVPGSVRLAFHDGSHLQLRRQADHWQGARTLAASSLYRIEVEGAPPLADELHRIDVRADRAPSIRVIAPGHTLTVHADQQKDWPLEFAVDDDFGIAKAELFLTRASGSGEAIAFDESSLVLQAEAGPTVTAADAGQGRGASLRYRHLVDLSALGFASDSELIARLVVSDNREPSPNVARSASLILRWPAPAATAGAGVEGIAQQTLPAYFRSQRQIIINTQALIAQKPDLAAQAFLQRSDAIGVDQKILRLRYGQFLGEESEGHAEAAVEGGQAAPDSQLGALAGLHGAEEHAPAGSGRAGAAAAVEAEFGHVHDIAEASTLLDPQTRATLKAALDQMWQAELHLRQGEPAQALPFEERALEFIKQAQQATRIYLARVGLELPVPDEKRRLSGERGDLSDRSAVQPVRDGGGDALAALWRALGNGDAPDWAAARTALRARTDAGPRQLDALAALDRAERDASCSPCRTRLRAALWALLPQPAAHVLPRVAPAAEAAAYLDAVQAARGERR